MPSFPLVFPLPHLLTPLLRLNHRVLYPLLFQRAVRTLQTFARAPQPLGAERAIPAVLHSWGQSLTAHSPVPCLVTGGGLTPEGTQGRPGHPRFVFAVQALSLVLRGKSLAGLRGLRAHHRRHCAGERAARAEDDAWTRFLSQVQDRAWVVYAKPPWGGPEQGLKYLSRYPPRGAIANARLAFVGDGVVRLRDKDYTLGGTTKVMALGAEEF